MFAVNIHLAFSHVPIFGIPILFILFGYTMFFQKKKFYPYIFWLYIIVFVFGAVLIITGDPSAELIENYPGISKDLIEEHENFAYVSFWLMLPVALLSAFSLYHMRRKNTTLKWINYTILILSFVSALTLVWTGRLGGSIRHSEISQNSSNIKVELIAKNIV